MATNLTGMTGRVRIGWSAVLAVAVLTAVRSFGPAEAERRMNRVGPAPAKPVSERAKALHRSLVVADLHADTLLWTKDPLKRRPTGHVDVPRLVEGGVALQVFGVVTQVPRGFRLVGNDANRYDHLTTLSVAAGWPPRTWKSRLQRALYQASLLDDAARRSEGRFTLIRTKADLAAFLDARGKDPALTAGLLGLEGAHALEGDLANADRLIDAGFRMVGLAHFFDNDVAGSAHGRKRGGLTALGRRLVGRLEEAGVLIDLAHASSATIRDVLSVARRPVVVSHTGVRGTCDNARNLSDAQLDAIAGNGGVVGIGYWSTAVCGSDAAGVARAVRHAVRRVGADHVALGSDFDGTVTTPFDTRGVDRVTEALVDAGLDEATVAKVMGGNVTRLLSATLP